MVCSHYFIVNSPMLNMMLIWFHYQSCVIVGLPQCETICEAVESSLEACEGGFSTYRIGLDD